MQLKQDTLWLSQREIAMVFGMEVPAISKHIRNILSEKELAAEATVSKMERVQQEGSRQVLRHVVVNAPSALQRREMNPASPRQVRYEVSRVRGQAQPHGAGAPRLHSHAGAWERKEMRTFGTLERGRVGSEGQYAKNA